MSMFCYQCQETSKGTGCEVIGVCGKTPEVSDIQDLLLFVNKGVAIVNDRLRKEGKASPVADKFVIDAMFMSITNANFDFEALKVKVKEGLQLRNSLLEKLNDKSNLPDAATWNGSDDEFMDKAKTCVLSKN